MPTSGFSTSSSTNTEDCAISNGLARSIGITSNHVFDRKVSFSYFFSWFSGGTKTWAYWIPVFKNLSDNKNELEIYFLFMDFSNSNFASSSPVCTRARILQFGQHVPQASRVLSQHRPHSSITPPQHSPHCKGKKYLPIISK